MLAMTKPTYTTIFQHAKNKKPAIVFVPTVYSHMNNSQSPDFLSRKLEVLEPFVCQIRKETLKETLHHGVGFLHEGLSSLCSSVKCIEIKDEMELSPLNLDMIASYYYISYTIIQRFSSLLPSKAKMKGLLEILTLTLEYDIISITHGEEDLVRRLLNHQRFSFENPKCTDRHGERDYEDSGEAKPSFTEFDGCLDNADIVEPDNEPPQSIGDLTNEVIDEKRDDGHGQIEKKAKLWRQKIIISL